MDFGDDEVFQNLFCSVLCGNCALAQEARKIDEFTTFDCEDYLSRMDNFQSDLANDKTAKGYVLVYDGKVPRYDNAKIRYVFPRRSEATMYLVTMRQRLLFSQYAPERIVFIKGGFREYSLLSFGSFRKVQFPQSQHLRF